MTPSLSGLPLNSISAARDGWRMPPEWGEHEATWLVWPRREASWPGKLHVIPPVFAEMVRAILPGEAVNIVVRDDLMEQAAIHVLQAHDAHGANVHFFHAPGNDSWVRDSGPTLLTHAEAGRPLLALDWIYNAWGGKFEAEEYEVDNELPLWIAEWLGIKARRPGMVLEGGSIDVDGEGLLLTTEQCLLNRNRNPHMVREEIEAQLRNWLGVRKVLWLGEGIVGDDTDGHVDDLTRFVGPGRVVTMVEENTDDENYWPLHENVERLESMTTVDGRPLEIVKIAMPDRVAHLGQRLPASYANFYICNASVLVPTFDCPRKDREALEILQACFPGRQVTGIRATDLVWGLGTFHCLTQQQPRPA